MTDYPEFRAAAPPLAAVVGWPVAHSLSPALHGYWLGKAGLAGHYVPVAAAPDAEGFARAAASLRDLGARGFNVTIPHKRHALDWSDDASDGARAVGAANMITFDDAGRAHADNSDVTGFAAALAAAKIAPGPALVLGAGGSARAILVALQSAGFGPIRLANRTRARAEEVARALGGGIEVVDWEERSAALAGAALLVNTTSLGMTGNPPLEIDLAAAPKAAVADIVYAPLETPLLAAARREARATVDGLAMLMHQAAPGFARWFGREMIPDAALRSHLEAILARRSAA